MRSLRMKMVMIMVILILALMLTTGAFLMSGVGNFYVSQFYEQMEETFTPEFIVQLQRLSEEDNAPAQMKALLMAQAGLGIDITGRNVYILDQTGSVLDSSNQKTSVAMTQNILSAMNGEVGQSSAITNNYMDLAVPVDAASGSYIAYIRDNRATVDALTSELLSIILRALVLGLVICVILSFLLSQILITPIRALTIGTKRVAAGDYTGRVTVDSRDEIGDLTQNFNHMAKVLQDTIAEAENERNKLSTLFLHMTDGVVAFNAAGSVIHYNPAATQMLAQNLSDQTTFDEIFSKEAELDTLLTLRRPQYIETQKTVGDRELELFMAPFSSDHTQGGVLVVMQNTDGILSNTESGQGALTQMLDRVVGGNFKLAASSTAVCDALREAGVKSVVLEKSNSDIVAVKHRYKNNSVFMFVNTSNEPVNLRVRLNEVGESYRRWDPYTGSVEMISVLTEGEETIAEISLPAYRCTFITVE